MRRIGVVTVIHDIGRGFGGAEVVAFEIARRLDADRFRSFVCITHAPPPSVRGQVDRSIEELRAAGVGVLALERNAVWDVLPWRKLFRLMREERISVVHTHMFRSSVPGVVTARLARVPVVIAHEWTWSFEGRHVRRFIDRNVIGALSNRMLAVSEGDRRRIVEIERIPASKVMALDTGLPDLPSPTGVDVRNELGIPGDAPFVAAMGRLAPQKDFGVLLEAVALLAKEFPSLRVAIFGEGPEREQLASSVTALSLNDVVMLAGHRHDVTDVLVAVDVAVLSSRYEGQPIALMEYMATGRPIVATNVGGIPELVDDGVEALLVDAGDAAALADAIGRLLRDRELAATLGAAAKRRQKAQLDMDVMVRRLEDLYLEELGAVRGALAS